MADAFNPDDRAILKYRSGLIGLRLSTALLRLHVIFKAGFRPDQPRVPAGNPDGGQWTDEGLAPTLVQSRSPREAFELDSGDASSNNFDADEDVSSEGTIVRSTLAAAPSVIFHN
jgi:hypothetical protein